jgi:hypothetical protein
MSDEQTCAKCDEWKSIATDLARQCVFALKFLDVTGSGMRCNPTTGDCEAWQIQFFDALDRIGYKVDREAYWRQQGAPKSKHRGGKVPA